MKDTSLRRAWRRLSIGLMVGLLALAAMPQMAQAAGFAARASISPTVQFVNDSAGVLFTVTVKNTGTVRSIGAVEIGRPTSFWTVLACPSGPAGWAASMDATRCRYTSAPGTVDDMAVGATATFQVVAATSAANSNRSGIWTVSVSTTDFSDPSWVKQAFAVKSGALTTRAYSFEVLGATVAASPATPGDPCPAPNKHADPGTAVVIVVCGTNHTSVTQTPAQALSSLSGTFMTSHGSLSSGPIAAGAMNVVLGNWPSVMTPLGNGTNYGVKGVIGGTWSTRTSPPFLFKNYVLDEVAPVAVDDTSYVTDEDTPLNEPAAGVLANDSDANLDPITAVLDAGPANAFSFTLNSDGSFSYTPTQDYNGSDSFTYHANDGTMDSSIVTVTITINPVNDAPVAVDDPGYTTSANTDLVVPADGVLGNDSDVDLDALNAIKVTDPASGTVTLNPDGSFTYSPNTDYTGPDSFTYKANDGFLDSNVVTVSITVS